MWIMILADLEDILSSNPQKYHVKSQNAVGDILFLKSQGWKKIALVSKSRIDVLLLGNKFALFSEYWEIYIWKFLC